MKDTGHKSESSTPTPATEEQKKVARLVKARILTKLQDNKEEQDKLNEAKLAEQAVKEAEALKKKTEVIPENTTKV